jgi:AraC family transcriptional regulator
MMEPLCLVAGTQGLTLECVPCPDRQEFESTSMQDEFKNSGSEFSQIAYSTRPDGMPIEWEAFRCRQWPGVRAQYRRLRGPVKFNFSISGKLHCFLLLDSYAEDGEMVVGDLNRVSTKDLRNKFIYADPASSISGWSRIERAGSFVLVEMMSNEHDEISDIPPIFMRASILMRSVLLQFKSLVIDETSLAPDYAETLGTMLRQELRRIHFKKSHDGSHDGGLTPRQLKSAIAYMDDRMDQNISIPNLAEHLGMSSFHFIRMFKKSAGLPPHRFFITRRVDRAKELLRSPHLSVSDVAEMSGFGGVTQLTRAFRRIVGTTPSAFRKELS